ncbi:hypothetical protein PS000_23885, partial [Shigella sonnei]|nr:hypothetical protein [Shigella sonnei]
MVKNSDPQRAIAIEFNILHFTITRAYANAGGLADGISVSTRYGEVENVEFNSDGALVIN